MVWLTSPALRQEYKICEIPSGMGAGGKKKSSFRIPGGFVLPFYGTALAGSKEAFSALFGRWQ